MRRVRANHDRPVAAAAAMAVEVEVAIDAAMVVAANAAAVNRF